MLVRQFERLDSDIWATGSRILKPQQLESLDNLIVAWREKNPGLRYVTAARFGEFEQRWRERVGNQGIAPAEVVTQMNSVNPLFIPRNHRIGDPGGCCRRSDGLQRSQRGTGEAVRRAARVRSIRRATETERARDRDLLRHLNQDYARPHEITPRDCGRGPAPELGMCRRRRGESRSKLPSEVSRSSASRRDHSATPLHCKLGR